MNQQSNINGKRTLIIYDSKLPALVSWFFPVAAITIGSAIFVRKGCATPELIQHELIHVEQGRELFYIGFWALYFGFWCFNVFKYGSPYQAYRMIPFELEARAMQAAPLYLLERPAFAWRRFTS